MLRSKVSLPFRPGTGFFPTWHDNLDLESRLSAAAGSWTAMKEKVEVVEVEEGFQQPTCGWLHQ